MNIKYFKIGDLEGESVCRHQTMYKVVPLGILNQIDILESF